MRLCSRLSAKRFQAARRWKISEESAKIQYGNKTTIAVRQPSHVFVFPIVGDEVPRGEAVGDIRRISEDTIREQNDYCCEAT